MLTKEIIARSMALRVVTGPRAEMPHGLAPAAQIGYGQAAGDHNRARSKPRTTGNGASRFAISFKKDDETGELILVKTKS